MTPEEQNSTQARQTFDNFAQRRISAYKQQKQQIDAEYEQQQSAKMENDTLNLYKSWIEATDKATKERYNIASRTNLVAEMISSVAKDNWYELTWNAYDVVDSYLQGFPQNYQAIYDFTRWNQDPEDFAVQMWWIEAPKPEWWFLRNVIGAAWDSASWIWKFVWNSAADIIWWTAKQLWADDGRVNYLVNDFKNYLDKGSISNSVGSDKDTLTYKGTKILTDLAQTAWLWAAAKWWVEAAMGWYPLVTKATPLWVKAAVWAVEWAADMWIYDLVSESELPSGKDLALGATLWVASPILWAGAKAVKTATKKRAVSFAEALLQNTNRMTKWEQSKFYQRFDQNVGKWLNDRWLKSWEDIINYFTNSKNKVDEAMATIKWEFTDSSLTDVLDDVVDFAVSTKSPQANRMIELAEKNMKWWLTMSEINEVKRYFEAHNKFNYLTKWTAEQAEKVTNMDSALREWQRKIAEENWFANLAELNKETAAAKEVLDGVKKRESWVVWNNPVSLTDVIVAFWWGGLSPESMAMYLLKKEWEAPAVRSKIVDMLNWIWGHETMTEKVADLDKIMEINKIKDQKALEKYVDDLYKEWWVWDTTPRLPESVEWWVAAWDRGFVTQNPSSPTYEQLWLQETRGINEINTAWQQGTKMYDIANQKYRWIADDIIANWGATLDAATMSKVWWDYYALSLFPNRNRQIPKAEFKDQHVLDYVEDNLDRLLEPWNSLWAWVSPTDMVHLDVSTTLPKKYLKQAKSLAKKYNQEAIYDLWTFEEIPTWWTWEPMDIDEEEVVKILKSLLSKKK